MNVVSFYKYTLGIEIGDVFSEVAIAHVDDPFNKFAIQDWKEESRKRQQFRSSIFYTSNKEASALCGFDRDDIKTDGIYIPNIKHYLFDIEESDGKLEKLKEGLTIKKLITDFLSALVKISLDRLHIHKDFSQSKYFAQDFSADNIRFCLVCPKSLQEFMRDCFINAGVVKEHEVTQRLAFVTEVEAVAYHQISLHRQVSNLAPDYSYTICHIDEISVGIAKINVDTTESLCTVYLVDENSKNGTICLEVKFREYLEDNSTLLCLNPFIINNLVVAFVNGVKVPTFYDVSKIMYSNTSIKTTYQFGFRMERPQDTVFAPLVDANSNQINISYGDLNRAVFLPFIKNITRSIINANNGDSNVKLILSGRYGIDPYFIENLLYDTKRNSMHDLYVIDNPSYAFCSGAVSSAMQNPAIQVPFVTDAVFDDHPEIDVVGGDNENDDYDFIVGIDFGTSSSGCSYIDVRRNKSFAIKTIDKWPGGGSEKAPTLLILDKKNKPLYWGENAVTNVESRKKQHNYAYFKLYLSPLKSLEQLYGRSLELEELNETDGYNYIENRTLATELTGTYLKLLKRHVYNYIVKKETGDQLNLDKKNTRSKKYKVKYVVTVPTIWNAATRTIFTRAIEADFVGKLESNQLVLVGEPEAAALYFDEKFGQYFPNQKDAIFIVCDADDLTVNVATMRLEVSQEENATTMSEPKVTQIGESSGDICGSLLLDERFMNYIQQFYKYFGVNFNMTPKDKSNMITKQFSHRYKNKFLPSQDGISYYDIDLPARGAINFTDSTKYKLVNGNKTLRITGDDMKEEIFDPVIDRVISLLNYQIKQVEDDGKLLNAILMVGSFSQTKYLQQRIKEEYKNAYSIVIHDQYNHAFSYGAAYYGLKLNSRNRKHTGFSLSLEVQAPLGESINYNNYSSKKVKGPNGFYYEKNRLSYFVKRDQELKKRGRRLYSQIVQVQYPKSAVIAIFSSDSDENAKTNRVTNCHTKIMETRINMPATVPGIENGDMIDFLVTLEMYEYDATVQIKCQNDLFYGAYNIDTITNVIPLILDIDTTDLKSNGQHQFVEHSLANRDYSRNYFIERLSLKHNPINNMVI
ncbi:hypothetical protein INT47_005903 [Mucor saturninus]|uniref:Heat shock protein 70 n=1 Tax=Mucor saturninus TaxID=64648 RepID=A0A8H7R6J1_9FUNG|nr:hypothetical protein INT47_005903 [Mucor saturninus]